MARITPAKVDQIILYLYAQGYKAGGARALGPDIVAYLFAQGHTMNGAVEKKLLTMPSAGWSSLMSNWTDNLSIVSSIFGINAYDIDEKYTKLLPTSRSIVLSPKGSPYGADGGGKGRATKFGNWNATGWDMLNLDSIAENNTLDADYLIKLQNLKSGSPFTSEFTVMFPGYQKGSALLRYSVAPPTVGSATPITASSTPAPATATATITEEEEEEIEEAIAELADSIITDLLKYQVKDDWSIFVKDGGKVPVVKAGDRKVSSKAYLANSAAFPVTSGQVIVTMPVLSPELGGIDIDLSVQAQLKADPSTMTNLIEVTDSDEEEYLAIAPPTVQFIIDADLNQVFISINGEVIPAVLNESGIPYLFDKLELIVSDPATSNKIMEVKLDGESLVTGRTVNNESYGNYNNYGFPLAGVSGLPPECYKEHYDASETAPGQTNTALAGAALWRYIDEGGRDVRFGTSAQSIIYNFEELDESYLQPLALDYDTPLDLDTQAVYFNLKYQSAGLTNSTLFPGFDITSGNACSEGILYPNDVSNLRPVNEDNKVMLQKFRGRKAGEGIEQIRVASSNLQGVADVEINGVTYHAEVFTQVEITFDGGDIMTIPDSDERFKAVDNSNTEIQGVVQQSEITEKPQMFILSAPTNLKEVYESIEKSRRSARLSDKNNRKEDNKIVTQTAMIKQGDSYYIIMGVGENTVVVELDMSKEE